MSVLHEREHLLFTSKLVPGVIERVDELLQQNVDELLVDGVREVRRLDGWFSALLTVQEAVDHHLHQQINPIALRTSLVIILHQEVLEDNTHVINFGNLDQT